MCVYMCMYVCVYVCVDMRVYMYVSVCVCTRVDSNAWYVFTSCLGHIRRVWTRHWNQGLVWHALRVSCRTWQRPSVYAAPMSIHCELKFASQLVAWTAFNV